MSTSNTITAQFWLAIASRDHVSIGAQGGFMQVCHGKYAPLKRLRRGDGVVYYSPTQRLGQRAALQVLSAIGHVTDDQPYQVAMTADFHPWRRQVQWIDSHDIPIRPLLQQLTFTRDQRHWGATLRFGLIRLSPADFALLYSHMVEGTAPEPASGSILPTGAPPQITHTSSQANLF